MPAAKRAFSSRVFSGNWSSASASMPGSRALIAATVRLSSLMSRWLRLPKTRVRSFHTRRESLKNWVLYG